MLRRLFSVLILTCLVVVLFQPAWARWRAMPWGLATIWWDLPPVASFESLGMDVEILTDLPAGQHIYLAPIGLGWLNDTQFYAGLQVGGRVPGGREDRIALLSRWGERRQEAIRTSPGGFSESSGHEGDFIGVRQVVPWRTGRYTVTLRIAERAAGNVWMAMTVTEAATARVWDIGMLRFPGDKAELRPSLASFVEVFGPPVRPETIPHATIRYGGLHINGRPVTPTRARILYSKEIPPSAAVRRQPGGAVAVDIGGTHDRRHLPVSPEGRAYEVFAW